MKRVNATWEKRNLGVDCVEIACDERDGTEALREALREVSAPYSVVKVPAGCPELLQTAQECGYMLAETSIEIVGELKKIRTPDMYNRFLPQVRMERASGEMLDRILDAVRTGSVFSTDRIAVDPHFSREIAGQRYYNWCRDALEQGAYMGILFYKDQPAAFNMSKLLDKGVSDGLLGGVLPEAANRGLGFLVVHGENEICRLNGGKTCLGRVSSNNLPILRLHLQYGYDIRRMSYVLTQHQ